MTRHKSLDSSPFRRAALAFGIVVLAGTQDALGFNYGLVLAPPVQVNNSTCQSYVLAMALAMHEPAGQPATYQWRMENESELRVHEANIRSEVVKAMKERLGDQYSPQSSSIREDWRVALKQITVGQYTVKDQYFLSLDDMLDFVSSRVPVRSKNQVASVVTLSTPFTLYFTSVSEIEGKPYSSGHIVSIIGIEADAKRNPRNLLIINSAAKGDDNECLPDEPVNNSGYFGKAGWVDEYVIKTFQGTPGPYLLNWVEPQ